MPTKAKATAITELGQKAFAFNPLAAEFTPILHQSTRLNPLPPLFIPKASISSSLPSFPTTIHRPYPPKTSVLNPQAVTFVPISVKSYRTIINPRAAILFPGKEHHPSTLNSQAPEFLPAYTPSVVSDEAETATEAPEQSKLAYPVTKDTSDFDIDPCTREELHFSDGGNRVKIPGLLPADESFDSSSCSVASTSDDIEYDNQSALICQDPDIHHFNWMGQGVMVKTSTPAAVSLTVVLTRAPARLVDEGNLRDQTILREAMLTIDPVVYYGDFNHVRNLTGEELRKAAIGAASVYYSPLGQWKYDTYGESDERPLTDELDMTRYIEGITIVNGWLENSAPTRQEYWKEAEEAYKSVAAMRKNVVEERKLFGVGQTPLRKVLTADGSELTIPGKQILSGDISGLIATALLSQTDKAASPLQPSMQEDFLFGNANWAGDLDDEQEIIDMTRAPTAPSHDYLFKNANWADDLDDEDEIVDIVKAPDVDQPIASLSPMMLGEQARTQREKLLVLGPELETAGNTQPIKSSEGLAHFRPVISGTGGFRFRSVVPIPRTRKVDSVLEKPVNSPELSSNSSFSHALESYSDAELEAEDEGLYGCGSCASSHEYSSSDEIFAFLSNSSSSIAEEPSIIAADETGNLQRRPQDEIDEEDNFIYDPAVAVTEPAELPTLIPFILPIRLKPIDKVDQVEPKQLALPFRMKPVYQIEPTQLTLPIRTKPTEPSSKETLYLSTPGTQIANFIPDYTTSDYIRQGQDLMASIRMSLLPKAAKISRARAILKGEEKVPDLVDGEVDGVEEEVSHVGVVDQVEQQGTRQDEEESDGILPSTPCQQILGSPTTPDSPTCSPCDSWDKLPAVVSPLGCKKGRCPGKARFVAFDNTKLVMPKLSLVPASMAAMIRTHAEKLEEIEEGNEGETENEAASNIGGHFVKIKDEDEEEEEEEEEEEVNAKVDLGISRGHIMLKRSLFVGNLVGFLEDDSGSEPATPERSQVPSPYKRPALNTPNSMLGKRVQFSFLGNTEDSGSTEELFGTRGIGAIFEDEEEVQDDSNILSEAALKNSDIFYFQPSLASRSFAVLPHAGTDSGNGSVLDDVFTAPSAGTTVPTTAEESEEGSPSPSIIAKPAQRPILVVEPWPETPVRTRPETIVREQPAVQKRKSSWATIKHSLSKKPSGGNALAADLQFTGIQRCTPTWNKVENKLQKPAPQVTANPNRKKGGFRKALKTVKNALTKGIKALA